MFAQAGDMVPAVGSGADVDAVVTAKAIPVTAVVISKGVTGAETHPGAEAAAT